MSPSLSTFPCRQKTSLGQRNSRKAAGEVESARPPPSTAPLYLRGSPLFPREGEQRIGRACPQMGSPVPQGLCPLSLQLHSLPLSTKGPEVAHPVQVPESRAQLHQHSQPGWQGPWVAGPRLQTYHRAGDCSMTVRVLSRAPAKPLPTGKPSRASWMLGWKRRCQGSRPCR